MKKTAIIATILLVLFSSTITAAADSGPKDTEVILSETPAVIEVGETIQITATAPKHGSAYVDSWENISVSYTELDPITGAYISKAAFTADKPGIYNISYSIKMTSGDSGTIFSKRVEKTIEVIDPLKVVGAVIKDLNVTPIYNTDGGILFYRACGSVYALWSDNTETPNGSVFFFFGPNEASKEINVTLYIEGRQYNYLVTVNR